MADILSTYTILWDREVLSASVLYNPYDYCPIISIEPNVIKSLLNYNGIDKFYACGNLVITNNDIYINLSHVSQDNEVKSTELISVDIFYNANIEDGKSITIEESFYSSRMELLQKRIKSKNLQSLYCDMFIMYKINENKIYLKLFIILPSNTIQFSRINDVYIKENPIIRKIQLKEKRIQRGCISVDRNRQVNTKSKIVYIVQF